MKKSREINDWLWLVLPVLILTGVGIFLFYEMGKKSEENFDRYQTEFLKEAPAVNLEAKENGLPEREVSKDVRLPDTAPEAYTGKEVIFPTESEVMNSLNYLEVHGYSMGQDMSVQDRFKSILKKISKNPPVSIGEGNNPELMIRNISYFFKVLSKEEMLLIRQILANEQDSLEMDLNLFFGWLKQPAESVELGDLRPSGQLQYQVAAFLTNTLGGRGYLYRRTPRTRMLIMYYCVQVLHEADVSDSNGFGIDVFPMVSGLKSELVHYPDFQYFENYLKKLEDMEAYYLDKR